MDRLGKSLSLCLGLILAVSVLFSVAVPIDAQTIPHPSVPEFPTLIILPLFIVIPVIIAIIYRKNSLLNTSIK
jgi:hypothetical protein